MITDFEFTKVFSLLITLKAVFYTNIILFRCNSNEDCTKDTCCRNAAEVEDIKKMDIDWGSDDEKE